jgi:nicotinamidase-related amidase
MTSHSYDRATTALMIIDPYNDFLSEGGKIWPRVKEVATEVGLLDNLRTISSTVRRNPDFHRAPSSVGARRF